MGRAAGCGEFSSGNNVRSIVIPAQAGIQWRQRMKERQPCVYMLASKRNGTLYIGVTSDLLKRVWEHKNNVVRRLYQNA